MTPKRGPRAAGFLSPGPMAALTFMKSVGSLTQEQGVTTMGWWRIDNVDKSQIAGTLPSGLSGGAGAVLNAVPGRAEPSDLYNGDGPADVMGDALAQINDLYEKAWGRRAQPDELKACFDFVCNGWMRRTAALA